VAEAGCVASDVYEHFRPKAECPRRALRRPKPQTSLKVLASMHNRIPRAVAKHAWRRRFAPYPRAMGRTVRADDLHSKSSWGRRSRGRRRVNRDIADFICGRRKAPPQLAMASRGGINELCSKYIERTRRRSSRKLVGPASEWLPSFTRSIENEKARESRAFLHCSPRARVGAVGNQLDGRRIAGA